MLERDKVYHGDCLELMIDIPDKSIDMILCDLPYGTTARNRWDVVLPFDLLWYHYKRVIKDNGAILLFADEPFTSNLIVSNPKMFKQRITWDKDKVSGFLNAKKMLLKQTEDLVLFYKKPPTYNPQMVDAQPDRIRPVTANRGAGSNYGKVEERYLTTEWDNTKRYPTNLIKMSAVKGECNTVNRVHPTQKPVELCEYFIKTYTNEGDVVLDNCCGSGSTVIACINTNRGYIAMEKEEEYYLLTKNRIKKHMEGLNEKE